MINFDNYVNENKTKHNKNLIYIPDHPCRMLIPDSELEVQDLVKQIHY